MIIGSILTAPLGVWLGRRVQRYQGGVPIVPYQRFVYDFPNVDPGYLSRKKFKTQVRLPLILKELMKFWETKLLFRLGKLVAIFK